MPIEINASPQLDRDAFVFAYDALQRDDFDLRFDGSSIEIGQLLGSGSSKEVYDSCVFRKSWALALPNRNDHVSIAFDKWQDVMREPFATDAIRNLGFVVNTQCRILPITVCGAPFPAITLTRYEDLPVEVRDRKNKESSIIKGDLFDKKLSLDTLISHCEDMIKDTATLVRYGVQLGSDSFNLCRVGNRGLRLYLNDLAYAEFEDLDEQDSAAYAAEASKNAVGAVIEGLSWNEYERHKKFFRGEDFHFLHGQAYKIFIKKVLDRLGISS